MSVTTPRDHDILQLHTVQARCFILATSPPIRRGCGGETSLRCAREGSLRKGGSRAVGYIGGKRATGAAAHGRVQEAARYGIVVGVSTLWPRVTPDGCVDYSEVAVAVVMTAVHPKLVSYISPNMTRTAHTNIDRRRRRLLAAALPTGLLGRMNASRYGAHVAPRSLHGGPCAVCLQHGVCRDCRLRACCSAHVAVICLCLLLPLALSFSTPPPCPTSTTTKLPTTRPPAVRAPYTQP